MMLTVLVLNDQQLISRKRRIPKFGTTDPLFSERKQRSIQIDDQESVVPVRGGSEKGFQSNFTDLSVKSLIEQCRDQPLVTLEKFCIVSFDR